MLTVQLWSGRKQGLDEMRWVATDRTVVFTHDHKAGPDFWLTRDYFPQIAEFDARRFPSIGWLAETLGAVEVSTVVAPRDCTDGFLGAFWLRPEAYLVPAVREAIFAFALLAFDECEGGLRRLGDDLASGAWERSNVAIRGQDALDLGYRLLAGRA